MVWCISSYSAKNAPMHLKLFKGKPSVVFIIILENTLLSIQCQNMTWTNFYVFQTCSTITSVTEMFYILKNNLIKFKYKCFSSANCVRTYLLPLATLFVQAPIR